MVERWNEKNSNGIMEEWHKKQLVVVLAVPSRHQVPNYCSYAKC